jgi:hypothetical protein
MLGALLLLAAAVGASSSSSSAPPPRPPPPFPPPSAASFPALFFGANASGAESAEQLAFVARHALAGYGWQANTLVTDYSHGEESLAAAARRAAAVAGAPPVFVYRHFQMAWTLFDVQKAAVDSPAMAGLFLRDNDNAAGGAQCRQSVPSGAGENRTSPLYAFSNASAGAFWVDEVAGELAREAERGRQGQGQGGSGSSSSSGISAAFFDETDWSACSYSFAKDGCANISDAFRAADFTAKLPALAGTAAVLAAARVWPIFSSKNLLDAAFAGLPPSTPRPCVLPGDSYFAALGNASYARFYEFWMGQGKELDTATIANALLEGAAGVGLVARAQADANASCPNATTAAEGGGAAGGGRDEDDDDEGGLRRQRAAAAAQPLPALSYSLSAFLIARTSPYSYFGVSTGWYDADWCWHAEYDAAQAACGAPAAAAVRVDLFRWSRAYERCDVDVDTEAATGVITPRGGW